MKKEKDERISLFELFITFFKINAVTFGGGYTIVVVLRDEFVNKKKLISEEDMLDLTALAQSGPGAMAINTSILTGYRLRGPLGAIISCFASVLPCLIIITIVYYFYEQFRSNYYINAALVGMGGVISGVMIITTINMAKAVFKKNNKVFSAILMVAAFVLSYFLKVNAALIIVIFAIAGLVIFSIKGEQK